MPVLHALILVALVAGTTAFVSRDKSVTLVVDGKSTEVRTFGATVADVLETAEVTVDLAHDLVSPLPDSPLRDGETVVVRYGRLLVLTVDSDTRTVWTTARTVSEALLAFGVRSEGAYVSASRSRPIPRGGLALDVHLPHRVTVVADGELHEVVTTATTIRSAIAEAGVQLREQDRIDADATQAPYDQQVIGVTRVDGKQVTEEAPIPFEVDRRKTEDLYQGETQVLKEGKVGIRVRRFVETYADGKLESRRLVEESVTKQPVTQVLLVGTKKLPENQPAADGLNWAALADCESGGNPRAVNPAGPYYGLYQFLASTWRAVGGVGLPSDASPAEQTYRAQILYRRSGAGQWPVCGSRLFS